MKAIVFAYHLMGCRGLEALIEQGFEIVAVFTHKDDPDENIWFPSVAELAASHGIPVHAPDDVNHPLWVERIRRLAPDVAFSFYYRKLLGEAVLDIPTSGAFNLHGSLLPRYRGRCPANWVLINGETETGVTLHHMTARPDAGDIVASERVPIAEQDTAHSLLTKLADAAGTLLERVLPRILDGTAPRTPQDDSQASTFPGRRPADGEIDWALPARQVRDLVRAVARPWPGAFTHLGIRKCLLWQASVAAGDAATHGNGRASTPVAPGTVVSADPLLIACGDGMLAVERGQTDEGIPVSGGQLSRDLCLVPGMRFSARPSSARSAGPRRVLILGVNGFIGSALSERLLDDGGYEVHGLDLHSGNVQHLLDRPGFTFTEGDISIHREWIEYHVRKCDVVLPLVAIATPIEYTRNPLRVFNLDFEENLKVVRYCVKYGKRLIFPSTSEVYGMCDEELFDEDKSRLVLGPINKERWIYSCSKQLLDRVIWAYGRHEGLPFTLFRPFNWIGPRLDSIDSARIGSSRAITQLILNLVEGSPIQLIDGGRQKRCFTDVSDGVECLFRLIADKDGRCNGQIVNIGNPRNEASIRELAELLVQLFDEHPLRGDHPPFAGFREVESRSYYGEGYEDVQHRRPSIRNAHRLVGWEPRVPLDQAVANTLDFFLRDVKSAAAARAAAPLPRATSAPRGRAPAGRGGPVERTASG